jgi:hypothetical protein
MADPKNDRENTHGQPKEAFIAQSDRPEMQLRPDTPLTELRVRDLAAILGLSTKSPFEVGKGPLKEFFDKPFPEVTKDWLKEAKREMPEKPPKEKNEKLEKHEKLEKGEIKELKNEKLEHDGVFDPSRPPGPDPRLEQVIQALAGLTQQVGHLANQVEELRKKTAD